MATRRGTCPVLTERTGKNTRHIMLRAVRAEKGEVPPLEGNYARCSHCGYEEKDVHFCDYEVTYYLGNWPHQKSCDKPGKLLVDELPDHRERPNGLCLPGRQYWVCTIHTQEAIDSRRKKSSEREDRLWKAQMDKVYYGTRGHGYENLLVELTDWLSHNEDLVLSDEWLAQIVGKMKSNSPLQDAVERSKDGK